ncbi:PH domain-containing protein [Actinoplanes sp. GCM10030250]|uniref:PH domain-containing protein n=1 Tax=Actinoplanes sp. GCM10030250 TaxID=3273376 RepID=UPI00360C9721
MGDNWIRPYTPGTGRWLVIAWEAIALLFLTWATINKFDLMGHGVRAVAGILAAVWVLGSWRIMRHGVYIGAEGVLVRGLIRSRFVPWHAIDNVRLHKASHRLGRWEIESGMTVLIELVGGATVNTELWAQGVDFHSRPKLFRAVYHELRTRHQAAANP